MKKLIYIPIGVLLGVVLYKSEAASWFRIQEMFRFDSFHMYGIIGSALVLGIILVQWIKRSGAKSLYGEPIVLAVHKMSFARYMYGGILFGLGWALAGACPGPIYILIGAGEWSMAIVLLGALIGAFAHGALSKKLPY